jgi:hypothetical protein
MNPNSKDLIFAKAWMTPEEQTLLKCLLEETLHDFAKRGVAPTAFLLMRLDTILTGYIVSRRLEQHLAAPADPSTASKTEPALIETITKNHERLRRAMKDIDQTIAKNAPAHFGLADYMKPLIERADGVLEEAIEFEAKKQKRREARLSRTIPPTPRNRTIPPTSSPSSTLSPPSTSSDRSYPPYPPDSAASQPSTPDRPQFNNSPRNPS